MEKVRDYIGLLVGPNRVGLRALAKDLVVRFKRDSLFQNSVYLMLSTGIMAVFGFLFWIIAARAYSPTEIGFATALISATILLSNFSILGFNMALVRYLPKALDRNVMINTAIIAVSVATLAISAGYLVGVEYFAPAFRELSSNIGYAVLFLIFMVMVSVNILTDSVFIAYRASKYNLIVYTFFGLTKIMLPLALVSFGAYGVFFAYTAAVVVSLALSFYFMRRHFGYTFHWTVQKNIATKMGKFSLANYLAAFMAGFPILVMPALIVGRLGADQSAFYYMASTLAGVLYIVPQATTQSLFAEGSHNEGEMWSLVKSAGKLIAVLLLPAVLLLVLLGKYILLIFGPEYSANSVQLLQIMAITAIFMAGNLIGSAIMKVRHMIKELVIVEAGYLIVTMLLTFMLLDKGIVGVGWALLGGQIFVCLEYVVMLSLRRSGRTKQPSPA